VSWKLPRGIEPRREPRVEGLGARLSALFLRVPAGARVVDVGTDHAQLPRALVRSGRSPLAIGVDLGPRARRADDPPGLELRRGDGLLAVRPGEVDVACFAGLGGRTVARCLAAASPAGPGLARLLLQVDGDEDRVRAALPGLGFALVEEAFVVDGRRFFRILRADRVAAAPALDAATLVLGHPSCHGDPLHAAWLDLQLARHAPARASSPRAALLRAARP
jgi:tRNA (adenine22-N1)-methyltransferase